LSPQEKTRTGGWPFSQTIVVKAKRIRSVMAARLPSRVIATLALCALSSVLADAGTTDARSHRHTAQRETWASHHRTAPRVLFVTAIFGTYEKTLKEPAAQTVPSDFVAFTDRDDLTSATWNIRSLPDVVSTYRSLFQPDIVGPNNLVNNSSPFMKVRK